MKKNLYHIKTILWIEAAVLLLLLGFLFLSKRGPAPRPPHPPAPPGEVRVFTGVVTSYQSNQEGDIDKLVLATGNGAMKFAFPPHTAHAVMQQAPRNSTITVKAVQRGAPSHHEEQAFQLISIEDANGTPELDIRSIAPPPPGGEQTMVSGTPGSFRKNGEGSITSFLLDGSVVTIPPHTRTSLGPLLLTAGKITVKGYAREEGGGFVNSSGLRIVRPYSIEIDGVGYLLQ